MRELYGHTLFGQSCLAARRLVEAGSRIVSVFWDEYGLAGSGWDTHYNHYARMKQELCPGLDQGWYGLITDLDRRGLLDDTLVVCTSEHGRTPKITHGPGGRPRSLVARLFDRCWPAAARSAARSSAPRTSMAATWPIGRSAPRTCWPRCITCWASTIDMFVHDTLGRPLPLVDGQVIGEALA